MQNLLGAAQSAPSALKRESFGLVQVLRGVAASWVVLFHASQGHHIDALKASIPSWIHPLFDWGNNGVAIFFALSGFVISHSLGNDRISVRYLGRFALRRSIRLDPALWASILLYIAFGWLSSVAKAEPYSWPKFAVVLSNATYTQLFFNLPSLDPVYWTLCYEVQFYLILIISIWAAQRVGSFIFIIPFAAALLWGCRLLTQPFPGLFVDRWHCFFLGVLSYWAIEDRRALIGFLLLSAALILAKPDLFTTICLITAAGLLVAGTTGFIKRGLAWPPLLFLGTISYSLYLTHNPITGASFFLLDKLGVPQWAALLASLGLCVIVSGLFWIIIERPTMRLAHKIKLPPFGAVTLKFASDEQRVAWSSPNLDPEPEDRSTKYTGNH